MYFGSTGECSKIAKTLAAESVSFCCGKMRTLLIDMF